MFVLILRLLFFLADILTWIIASRITLILVINVLKFHLQLVANPNHAGEGVTNVIFPRRANQLVLPGCNLPMPLWSFALRQNAETKFGLRPDFDLILRSKQYVWFYTLVSDLSLVPLQPTAPCFHVHRELMCMYVYICWFLHSQCLQCFCLQCFDAVGWVAGRASGL